MEPSQNAGTPAKTSILAVISLVFAAISIAVILLVVILSFIFTDYFSAPPGHTSVLLGQSAWVYYLAACILAISIPAALITSVIALVLMSTGRLRPKGKGLAWTSLGLTTGMILSGICILASPLLIAIISQPKSAAPAIQDLAALSGEWSGSDTLTSIGACQLEGGKQSVTNAVKMIWTVDGNGDVTIKLPGWPGVYPYTFTGEVQPDLDFELILSTSALCLDAQSPYIVRFRGTIDETENGYSLDMRAREIWCPGSCIFERQYTIQKTR